MTTSRGPVRSDRRIGMAHLTMLDVSPPDLITASAAAGFDFVGLRVCAGGPGEDLWMELGSPMLAETRARLDDTGLDVLDIDILPIRPATTVADVLPALDVAALLGARYAIAFVEDADTARAGDTVAAIAEVAAERGLRVLVEAMAYKAVRSLRQTLELLAHAPGTGIVVDPLQLNRCGDTVGDLRGLDPALLPLLQLCDAPAKQPAAFPWNGPLPRGQAPGTIVGQLEARAWRLPAGEGQLPLLELLDVLPDAPISVEAPNLGLSKQLTPTELAQRHMAAVRSLVAGAPAAHATAG